MKLTEKQTQFFAAMEEMFLTPGWELVTRGWKVEQDQLADAMFFNAKTLEDMSLARARHALLDELIKLPATITAQKAQIEEQDEDDQVDTGV